ncbi:MAG: ROK family protein [Luteitalea sp.]|nr:ROK family protein [Luteitalea sp.]
MTEDRACPAAIGIDAGGTTLKGVVVNHQGRVLATHRLPAAPDAKVIVTHVRDLIDALAEACGTCPDHLGFAAPGVPDVASRSVAFLPGGKLRIERLDWTTTLAWPTSIPVINGFLGGTSTAVLDTFYGFYTPGDAPRKVIGGVPDRVVAALRRDDVVLLRPNTYGAGAGVTYNPERLKAVWDELAAAAGVTVLHHAWLLDVEVGRSGRVVSAILATKSGLLRVEARRFIDASGDADLCALAGVPFERAGDLAPAQTLTTTFRLCNVDLARYEAAGGKAVLHARMAEAVEQGRHALPRRSGSAHRMTIEGCVATVATRVAEVDATDPWQLSRAERDGRQQAFAFERFFREAVPGFERCRIVALSTQIGVRETRRVHGEYRLTRDDCLSVRRFDDRILLCGAPIEDHRAPHQGGAETVWTYMPDGQAYDVPYRTLVPKDRDELWVAGRCFSATHDAHASCRSMAQTMSMGQTAGLAAALSLEEDCGARNVAVARLQDRLRLVGAVLEVPADVATEALMP